MRHDFASLLAACGCTVLIIAICFPSLHMHVALLCKKCYHETRFVSPLSLIPDKSTLPTVTVKINMVYHHDEGQDLNPYIQRADLSDKPLFTVTDRLWVKDG